MSGVLLLAVFLLSCSFPARAQDVTIVRCDQAGSVLREYADKGYCSYTCVVPTESRAEGCSPSGQTSTEAVTQEEMDGLKNQVDRLLSMMESLSGQLTQALHQLDSLTTTVSTLPRWMDKIIEADCAEYYASGRTTSGVYTIGSLPNGTQAYCDMDTAGGGWTVLQRRQDGSVPFNRKWEDYKQGFGDKSGEYWLGNENIHLLTNQKNYRLRVDLEDWDGNRKYAEYSSFRVSGEADQYQLEVSGYTGDAGDSMTGRIRNNGQRFSTVDRDNDDHGSFHCSQQLGQGGWWYRACSPSLLNGRYLGNCGSSCPTYQGVVWYRWRGYSYSLKSVSMKIRP